MQGHEIHPAQPAPANPEQAPSGTLQAHPPASPACGHRPGPTTFVRGCRQPQVLHGGRQGELGTGPTLNDGADQFGQPAPQRGSEIRKTRLYHSSNFSTLDW